MCIFFMADGAAFLNFRKSSFGPFSIGMLCDALWCIKTLYSTATLRYIIAATVNIYIYTVYIDNP